MTCKALTRRVLASCRIVEVGCAVGALEVAAAVEDIWGDKEGEDVASAGQI